MSTIDWFILTSTISFIVIYGIWQNKKHKNLNLIFYDEKITAEKKEFNNINLELRVKDKENEIDNTKPNIPFSFGICLLYSPSPNTFLSIVNAVP